MAATEAVSIMHRRATPEAVLAVTRDLVAELQSGQARPDITLHSDLDRDVGLDSLARVELLLRLQARFGVALPDETAIAARTPADLVRSIEQATATPRPDRETFQLRRHSAASAASEPGTIPTHAATLIDVLDFHAQRTPDDVHLWLCDEHDNAAPLTFHELQQAANETAAGLQSQGLEAGQPVAIMLPTSMAFFSAFHGVLRAGGVPVPLYPPFRPDQIEDHCRRLAAVLQNAEARIFIADPNTQLAGRLLQAMVPTLAHVATVDTLRAASSVIETVPRAGDDLAFLQYTSGTTGIPKGVMLTHANLLTNIRLMGEALDVSPERDVFVSWLPLYHDMGLIGACFGTLYFRIPLVLMSPLQFMARPQRWLWAIHRHGGTISPAPNFAYDLCAGRVDDRDLAGLDLSSWRLAANGAEPVSPRTLERFCNRFAGHGFRREAMTPVYGLAESSLGVSFPPPNRGPKIDRVQRNAFETERRADPAPTDAAASDTLHFVACGSALPGHDLQIVDHRGRPLPDRHEGNLQFRGPSCTQGYYRNPEATRELLDGDWRNSGDLAYLVDGELYITGRTKDVIIRAGRNIYPYEIERAVSEVRGIRKNNVAAFSVPDTAGGPERIVVMAETRETDKTVREALRLSVREAASAALGHAPDEVVLTPPGTVVKTSSGKIRRGACRKIYENGAIGRRQGVYAQLLRLTLSSIVPTLHRSLRAIGQFAFVVWCWSLALGFGLPAAVLILIAPGIRIRAALARAAARTLLTLSGTRLHVEGTTTHADGPVIIVANHQSYLDGVVMRAILHGPVFFVAKRELQSNLLIRLFLQRVGVAFIDRHDHERSLEDLEQIRRRSEAGETAVFFPEGTFTPTSGLRSFRIGAFMVATQTGIPVLPIAIRGARAMLRGKSGWIRPGQVHATLGAPLAAQGRDWQAANQQRERARAFILAHCGEPDLD